jgi:hypothetical protein
MHRNGTTAAGETSERRSGRRLRVRIGSGAAATLLVAGLALAPGRIGLALPAAQAAVTARYVGQMALSPAQGTVGSRFTLTASGMPARTAFQVVWEGEKGSWLLKGAYHETFAGRAFQPTNRVIGQVRSTAAGRVKASFAVPAGFGAGHTVELVARGVVRNQALFNVEPSVSLASTSGPPGSPIELTMQGIGAASYSNNWMLTYDNRYTGWISSVTTNGTAHVTLPAVGGAGRHIITIEHGAYQFPYLNSQQSPHPKPVFRLVYTVTSGSMVMPPALKAQGLPTASPRVPAGSGPAAWVGPASAPVGTPLTVHARGLAPEQRVRVVWQTVVGSHVTATGWSAKTRSLGTATASAKGNIAFTTRVPDDVGGTHAVRIVAAGGKTLAQTSFTLTPSAVAFGPRQGPAGTTITIRLKGVGWTDTGNIYTLDYDNAYTGYACGFNSHGDVTIHLAAAGSPGWHEIVLYPAIYQGTDITGTDDFRLPQLTYASDHPGGTLPAFRFAFRVTR